MSILQARLNGTSLHAWQLHGTLVPAYTACAHKALQVRPLL